MFKKVLTALLITALLFCSACGKNGDADTQNKQLYSEAVAALQKMEPDESGLYETSAYLVTALENAAYTEPENVIVMIGDGMGFPIIEAAQVVHGDELYQGTLAMNYLPAQGTSCTYSASDQITDSAAGATAIATGYKTMNGTVAMDSKGKESFKTVLELAAEKGKSTGVVATKSVTDATPAAFTAHVISRTMQQEIAGMQLEKLADGTVDLLLGGGYKYFDAEQNAAAVTKATDSGVKYTHEWSEASGAELPVLGLFAENMMDTTDEELPTVAEMTDYALKTLSKDENGFFLMVEGSQIDTYGEKNEFDREVKELYDFDCAVAVAMRYVALNPNTVLIVTADHETGNLTLPENPTKENIKESFYTTGKHTCKTVPILAAGYQTEKLAGMNENVDIARFIAGLLGEKDFGKASVVHTVLDTAEKSDVADIEKANPSKGKNAFLTKGDGTVKVSFTEEETELSVPTEALSETDAAIKNARAFHMTVKNPTNERMPLPQLKICTADDEYIVNPQEDYIEPGQAMELSYVLPFKLWRSNAMKKVSAISLGVQEKKSELEISSLRITDRELTQ